MIAVQFNTRRVLRMMGIVLAGWALAASPQARAEVSPASLMGGPALASEDLKAGARVYQQHCAACHDAGINRAPQKTILRSLRPDAIYRSLTSGVMKPMAGALNEKEKVVVSEYLGERKMSAAPKAADFNLCSGAHASFDRARQPAFAGWGMDIRNSHSVSREAAGIGPDDLGGLKLKWAFGFPDSTRIRAQPSLAAGALFIGSQNGYVRALDRETGCVRWRFEAAAEVRTGIVIAPWQADDENADPLAYFGDLVGNLYAVRAFTGELVWKKRGDSHGAAVITGTPALYQNQLYITVSSLEEAAAADPRYACCSFRGSVAALDAATGEEKWRTFMVDEPQRIEEADGRVSYGPSGVAVWSSPAIDAARGRIYVATGDNYSQPATELSDAIVALDMQSGAIRWRNQVTQGDAWNVGCYVNGANCPEDAGPDFDFGAAPILATTSDGTDLVLAGQKSGIAYAFNAQDGTIVWQQRLGRGGLAGGVLFGIAAADGKLFVPISDFGEMEGTSFPVSPGLNAVDIDTGQISWRSPMANTCAPDIQFCQPGISAAITATPDMVLTAADDGHFRAYSAETGQILLDLDLLRSFKTVNGVAANGGATGGGAAPIVDRGQLIVASGYGHAMKMPGNVLLVFEKD